MKKIKVVTVVGTRPEIIRLSRIIGKLDQYCDHILVHTGQNYDYELNQIFFTDLNIRKPDYFLNAAGATPAETIGKVIINVDNVLENIKPDALLILGDTNSCLSAIPAKRRRIPIFHMEAGNRCFDMRVPEEINRLLVDNISDINLTYSDIARDYLLREGGAPDRIIKTGSPMFEVLSHYRDEINRSNILERLNIKEFNYFVVSVHREENIDSDINLNNLIITLNTIAERYEKDIIFSIHPRTKKKIVANGIVFHPLVRLLAPLGFKDYIKLQLHAKAVLSDSGTITEESSILNIPAINLREAHERPEGMEEAAVMMTGLDYERVLQALEILENQPRGSTRLLQQVADYSISNVSDKVLRIILSYTSYIKRVVWREF
ncbi:non-hydrolyzing UDP-N-acetylglucosamine 2-epimerase [Yersinia mollaretii]|uniref:non-hydrolyzing UDP-N-acetylglucosamine 2-epimerase n=1 Tax=Yersinia mollaretii TaxID=33060 RepID=UPI0025AAB107|nr:UDP-N-acetylglucosamine 2-epimerase (non-hydrolyzing) [Yersinia mollaretii]MDN0109161.1 UDP-N-acetylglucosamine 2-epimerase (non-hydrolyzing) [Yersinia mollaretii]